MKTNILFINLLIDEAMGIVFSERGHNAASLGLCCLASNLQKHNYKTEIIDMYAFGYRKEDVLKYIDDRKPSIIGIHTFSFGLRHLYHLIKHLKEANRDNINKILLGGPHITVSSETVKDMGLKYGMIGDSDESIVKFCKYILNKEGNISDIPGLIYLDNDTIKTNPQIPLKNLDNLPTADYSLFLRRDKGWGTIWIDGIRGCPCNCSFCPTPLLRGRRVIYKSCNLVIEDIKEIVKKHSPRIIEFAAEDLTYNKNWILQFCHLKKKENIKVKWGSFASINNLDKEMIKEMAESGCVTLSFGIESGNERIRKFVGKSVDLSMERCKEIVSLCKKNKIATTFFFIMGFPYENENIEFQVEENIKFASATNSIYPCLSIYHILPGSQLYFDLIKQGRITDNIWKEFVHNKKMPVYIPTGYSADDLLRVQVKFYRKQYLSLSKIFHSIIYRSFARFQLIVLLESIKYEVIKPVFRYFKKLFRVES